MQKSSLEDKSGIQNEIDLVVSKIGALTRPVSESNNEEIKTSISNFEKLLSDVLREGVQRHEEFLLNDIAVMRTAKVGANKLKNVS